MRARCGRARNSNTDCLLWLWQLDVYLTLGHLLCICQRRAKLLETASRRRLTLDTRRSTLDAVTNQTDRRAWNSVREKLGKKPLKQDGTYIYIRTERQTDERTDIDVARICRQSVKCNPFKCLGNATYALYITYTPCKVEATHKTSN